MEEAIRKLEKMIENPSRADKIVYTRGDIEDAIEGINRLKDRIKELEEENTKLKEDKDKWKYLYFEEVAKCDKLKSELGKFVKDGK